MDLINHMQYDLYNDDYNLNLTITLCDSQDSPLVHLNLSSISSARPECLLNHTQPLPAAVALPSGAVCAASVDSIVGKEQVGRHFGGSLWCPLLHRLSGPWPACSLLLPIWAYIIVAWWPKGWPRKMFQTATFALNYNYRLQVEFMIFHWILNSRMHLSLTYCTLPILPQVSLLKSAIKCVLCEQPVTGSVNSLQCR